MYKITHEPWTEVTKGNVMEQEKMISIQTINEMCEWCVEGIEPEMCQYEEMDKRCKADLEGGDGIQNKAMRK